MISRHAGGTFEDKLKSDAQRKQWKSKNGLFIIFSILLMEIENFELQSLMLR